MSKTYKNSLYSFAEELANAITHGLGAALAVAGLVILIVCSVVEADAWKVVSAAIYGASLFILFISSTMYHALVPKRAKAVFRIIDHAAVFVLIAGTYTPITLVTLRGGWGWSLFGIVWGFAVLGIVLNCINIEKYKKISLICYIATGWVVIIAIWPMIQSMALPGLLLMLAGGIFYTGGVFFYRDKKRKFFHSVWHLFVLGGAVCHYFCVLRYIVMA